LRLHESIGHIVHLRRNKIGMTLRELSGKSNISLGYLSEVERGKKEASSDIVENIAYALDVPSYVIVQEAGLFMEREELRVPYSWEAELDSSTARV